MVGGGGRGGNGIMVRAVDGGRCGAIGVAVCILRLLP